MAHLHEVKDKDTHFMIDPETMEITNASKVKALKQGDHGAERFTFEMPRYIEGHDMSVLNKVEVHYNNIKYDATTRETTTNSSFDDVDDFRVSLDSEDTVVWSWLIKGDATKLDGTLSFCFRFACMNGDMVEYQKFSEIFVGVPVGKTIFNTEAIAKEYADVLEAWRVEILDQIGDGGLPIPEKAEPGQILLIDSVSEDGKVETLKTAWPGGQASREVVVKQYFGGQNIDMPLYVTAGNITPIDETHELWNTFKMAFCIFAVIDPGYAGGFGSAMFVGRLEPLRAAGIIEDVTTFYFDRELTRKVEVYPSYANGEKGMYYYKYTNNKELKSAGRYTVLYDPATGEYKKGDGEHAIYKNFSTLADSVGHIKQVEMQADPSTEMQIATKRYVDNSIPEQAQSDWEENDPEAPGYVKNRPFYRGRSMPVMRWRESVTFDGGNAIPSQYPTLEDGREYTLDVDGVEYYGKANYVGNPFYETMLLCGNFMFQMGNIVCNDTSVLQATTVTMTLYANFFDYVKIPVEYIPAEVVKKDEIHGYIPVTLPNRYPLTFTGAVDGMYDGRETLIVNIPAGGGTVKYTIGDDDKLISSDGVKIETFDEFKAAFSSHSMMIEDPFNATLKGYSASAVIAWYVSDDSYCYAVLWEAQKQGFTSRYLAYSM